MTIAQQTNARIWEATNEARKRGIPFSQIRVVMTKSWFTKAKRGRFAQKLQEDEGFCGLRIMVIHTESCSMGIFLT